MSKKIYINPGHSDRDPGAVGYEVERELNVKVSNHMKEHLLANYECEVRMNPGTMDSLADICNDANSWGADLLVSNHFNAAKGDGYENYIYSKNRVELGKIFAKHVENAGQNLRYPDTSDMPFGVKIRPGLYALKHTSMPAILNEGAFVDNWEDIKDWNDDEELKKLGIAYAEATAEAMKLEKKKETYTSEEFVRDVQAATGAAVYGNAGPQTLQSTVTISAHYNHNHPVILPVQKRLFALGYTEVGEADGIAGAKFTSALARFQMENDCTPTGIAEAWGKTWHKLLEMG